MGTAISTVKIVTPADEGLDGFLGFAPERTAANH